MERLQKKCLMASLLTHGALVLALVFGAAFIKHEAPEPLQQSAVLQMITLPAELTDGMTQIGGGSPQSASVAPAPAAPVQPERQAEPEPAPVPPTPTPVVESPRPVVEPPTVKAVEPPPVPKPKELEKVKPAPKPKLEKVVETPKPKPAPAPEKKKIAVVLDTVVRKPDTAKDRQKEEQRQADERARQAADRQRQNVQTALKNLDRLGSTLSTGTTVDVASLGVGSGGWGGTGPTLVNYAQWVKEIYDRHWIVTDAVKSDDGIVKVEIVVQRNGDARGKILRGSGDATLDRTVQTALDRVKNIGYPFPDGAKDSSRTFIINFNVKSRRGAG
jgi:outer membrane biosynthesis protein TonB